MSSFVVWAMAGTVYSCMSENDDYSWSPLVLRERNISLMLCHTPVNQDTPFVSDR